MKLYVIGNGFDLHYELPTKPDDFVKLLAMEKVYNSQENAKEEFSCYGVNWSDYEEDIANLDLTAIEDSQLQYPDYLSDHEYDRDGCIQNMEMHLSSLNEAVFSALRKMAFAANEKELEKDYCFDSDYIINFNYTNTVEKVSINRLSRPVFYIHGTVERGDDLVFGYKNILSNYNTNKYSNADNGDYYLDTQVKLINDFYRSFKKKLCISGLESYLNSITDSIDSVFVLGHSLGDVDLQYFEVIDQLVKPSKWCISYHSNNDPVIFNIKKLSFFDKIQLFIW